MNRIVIFFTAGVFSLLSAPAVLSNDFAESGVWATPPPPGPYQAMLEPVDQGGSSMLDGFGNVPTLLPSPQDVWQLPQQSQHIIKDMLQPLNTQDNISQESVWDR